MAEILSAALEGPVSRERMERIVREKAFPESALTIVPALLGGRWPLLSRDGRPVLKEKPSRPLTLLEKRWLKAVSLDPRMALFDLSFEGLEGVEPLFTPDDFVFFDRYADADPYEDPGYIRRFRTILSAIREKKRLRLVFLTGKGRERKAVCRPVKLEYSEKDDKFRLAALSRGQAFLVNLARIREVSPLDGGEGETFPQPVRHKKKLVFLLTNRRNALERAMLHFAHFEKTARQLGNGAYQVSLWYDAEDETELLIRVLSFGPMLRVTEPESFVGQIRERLARQKALFDPPPDPPPEKG